MKRRAQQEHENTAMYTSPSLLQIFLEGEGYGNFSTLWLCNVRAVQNFVTNCFSVWTSINTDNDTYVYMEFQVLSECGVT